MGRLGASTVSTHLACNAVFTPFWPANRAGGGTMIWKGAKNEALSLWQERIRKAGRHRRAGPTARFVRGPLQHRPGRDFSQGTGEAAQDSPGIAAAGAREPAFRRPIYSHLEIPRDRAVPC